MKSRRTSESFLAKARGGEQHVQSSQHKGTRPLEAYSPCAEREPGGETTEGEEESRARSGCAST